MSSTYPAGDINVAKATRSAQLTVGEVVVGLADAAGLSADDVMAAHEVILTLDAGALRFLYDGTPPTGTRGLLHKAEWGALRVYGAANLKRLRLVRAAASSADPVRLDLQLGRVR